MNKKLKTIIQKIIREELNLIESFDILNNTPKQIIKHVGNDTSGFNNSEEAEEEIENLINMDFPYGFKNIPNEVILYRVLLLKDGESVNEENVGEHFISESNLIDIGFLEEEWTKLFKKTFKFTGGEIVNEFLMSTGYLPGEHSPDCTVYEEVLSTNPMWNS
jgi:3-methyladenine DNA glycosylase Tag